MAKKKRSKYSKAQRNYANSTNRLNSPSIPNAIFTDSSEGNKEAHSNALAQDSTTSDTVVDTKTMRTLT